jgi:hypothetical protein
LRNYFLDPNNYSLCNNDICQRFGIIVRKLWSRNNFKSFISPIEFIQTVSIHSKKRFNTGKCSEVIDFFVWLINELNKGLLNTKDIKNVKGKYHITLMGDVIPLFKESVFEVEEVSKKYGDTYGHQTVINKIDKIDQNILECLELAKTTNAIDVGKKERNIEISFEPSSASARYLPPPQQQQSTSSASAIYLPPPQQQQSTSSASAIYLPPPPIGISLFSPLSQNNGSLLSSAAPSDAQSSALSVASTVDSNGSPQQGTNLFGNSSMDVDTGKGGKNRTTKTTKNSKKARKSRKLKK